jgi:hypothetical protein
MNRGRVGEERGGKETDRCPLTVVFGLSMAAAGMTEVAAAGMTEVAWNCV